MARTHSQPIFFLFGAPRLEREGAPVELDTRKALALLAYLALTRTAHSRDALATLLWEDYDQSRARAALRRTLSVLHSALGDGQLEIDRENVGLNPQALLWVDVYEFRQRVADTQKHKHPPAQVCPRCITPLSEAVALYRDDLMGGFTLRDAPSFDEWQFFQSEELRRELAAALEKLTRYYTAAGEFDLATVYARRWLGLDPLHEPAHRQLMQLYALAGQRAAALRQYQECERVLRTELGVAPLEETTRLYETIRRGEGDSRRGPGDRPEVIAITDATAASEKDQTALPPPYSSIAASPLVGRDHELAVLNEAYGRVRGDGYWVTVEGEAGIGKTRLAETFLGQPGLQDALTLTARCYEGGTNLAYAPFIEALRSALNQPKRSARVKKLPAHLVAEAARLLPELRERLPRARQLPPLEGPGAQSRFFEGVCALLIALVQGPKPGILFLDDLQWADAASIDLLHYLAQRLSGHPFFILTTVRAEEMLPQHRLRQALAEQQRAGMARRIPLERLSANAVVELARRLAGASEETGQRLARETEGLPFFVVEYLAALHNTPAEALPLNVRNLLHSRLARVGETSAQALSAAAVIGRSFDFETLRMASGRSEVELVGALEELAALGLVKEVTGADRLVYDFSHEKLRALVYDETSGARRRLLHRRVAEALVGPARTARERDALAGQIAFHYQQAGARTEAARYFQIAGEHARALYANAQALAHFQAALALDPPDPAPIHMAIGDLQTLHGDYGAALESYRMAAGHGPASAILEHKRGISYHRQGDWERAEEHFRAALAAPGDATEQARIYADWSLNAHRQGNGAQALVLACRALELAETVGDRQSLAQAHNILGILASKGGEREKAEKHLGTSLALAEEMNDPNMRVAALNNLALTASAQGETTRALEFAERALDLCKAVGDRHRQAALHNNIADLHHALGQQELAMAHLKDAVRIFAEIGNQAGNDQAEIWKLVEW